MTWYRIKLFVGRGWQFARREDKSILEFGTEAAALEKARQILDDIQNRRTKASMVKVWPVPDRAAGERTEAENARQEARGRNGKYRKHNPCEVCRKSCGLDYYSDRRCDEWGGLGVVLCAECGGWLDGLPDDQALAGLQRARAAYLKEV